MYSYVSQDHLSTATLRGCISVSHFVCILKATILKVSGVFLHHVNQHSSSHEHVFNIVMLTTAESSGDVSRDTNICNA